MDIVLQKILECMGPRHGARNDLAEYLGISGNAITNWKNGHSQSYMKWLPRIAEFYGYPVEYFTSNGESEDVRNMEVDNCFVGNGNYEIFAQLMEEKGVSSYKVAKDTGITQATFSRWKNGKVSPSLETLQALANYFGVSVDYLLGKTDEKKSPADAGDGADNFLFALFGDASKDITEEDLEDVKRFAQFIAQRKKDAKEKK